MKDLVLDISPRTPRTSNTIDVTLATNNIPINIGHCSCVTFQAHLCHVRTLSKPLSHQACWPHKVLTPITNVTRKHCVTNLTINGPGTLAACCQDDSLCNSVKWLKGGNTLPHRAKLSAERIMSLQFPSINASSMQGNPCCVSPQVRPNLLIRVSESHWQCQDASVRPFSSWVSNRNGPGSCPSHPGPAPLGLASPASLLTAKTPAS